MQHLYVIHSSCCNKEDVEWRRDGKYIFQGPVVNESASFNVHGRDTVSLAVLKFRLVSPT
jgi:hypothetical protein